MLTEITYRKSQSKYFRVGDARKAHEVHEVVLVRASGLRVRDIREPLDLRWHIGQVQKFLRAQSAGPGWNQRAGCFFLGYHGWVRLRCRCGRDQFDTNRFLMV